MDIKFNILLIEDDPDFSKETKENLEEKMNYLNLLPNIISKSSYPKDKIKDIGAKFDLLIVDYNLSNDEVGTELISKVRNLSMLPDIIFYSSQSSIEDIITREERENRVSLITLLQKGIYFSNSENLENIAIDVIKKITNREEKINGFKGMVLSYVSEYEDMVNRIIGELLEKTTDLSSIEKYISAEILGSMSKKANQHKEIFDNEISPRKAIEILDSSNRHIDHSKRFRVMNRILEKNGFETIDFNVYKEEILDLRNSLSHIHVVNDDLENTYYIFTVNNKTQILTPEYCSSIRILLSRYKKIFIELTEKVKINELNNELE